MQNQRENQRKKVSGFPRFDDLFETFCSYSRVYWLLKNRSLGFSLLFITKFCNVLEFL